jgi:hypothetical protein
VRPGASPLRAARCCWRGHPAPTRATTPWAGFLGELVTRGLRAPLLVCTDGAPGLIGAVEVVFWQSLRQRCLVHRARNLLARVPTHAQDEVKAAFWQIFAEAFADRYGKRYPAAVTCLLESLPELTTFLRFPEVVDQPVTPAAYHAPSGAREGPRPPAFHHKRDATPGEDAQPEAA